MDSMNIAVDDAALQAAITSLQHSGQSMAPTLRPVMARHMLATEGRAKPLTPRATTALSRSGESRADLVGNNVVGRVAFGGLAAKYAEVQHENETFAHTPEAYQQKFGRPLNRTGYTRQTLRGTRTKRGKIVMKSKTWRYKRKQKIRGYKGGQAHFLYGRPNSAWNPGREAALREALLRTAQESMESALRARGID